MQDIIDGILPFIKYLQSSNDIKKKRGFTYVNSKYNIGILVKKNLWVGYIWFKYDGFNFSIKKMKIIILLVLHYQKNISKYF